MMETIYYNLDARQVSACDMASGEALPQCRSYAFPRRKAPRPNAGPGKVLDLEAYRRKLAEERDDLDAARDDWEGDLRYGPAVPPPAAQSAAPRRSHRAGLTLEFLATLAILVMAVVVITVFLPLL